MKSVVICGSRRFKPEIRKFTKALENKGVVVYSPFLHDDTKGWSKLTGEYRTYVSLGLTHEHIYKIKMADVVYVFNKNGYAGVSTTLEIGASLAMGKPIYAYSNDEEHARNNLFREIIKTPAKLMKKL